ncbi:MAG: acetate--CoA ligase family protein [Chloroflexi bacterium]|nr:acetate--CoA ligase family protein [Chloroflexota bacterium]
MKVHESDARQIFADQGLPVPPSRVATTPDEAATAAGAFGGLVVVKALVLAGGRGKAGGVKLADGPEAAREAADAILGLEIRGERVRRVLVAPAVDIDREIYLGVTIDRERQSAVVMASAAGGIDIEEVAAATPEAIQRVEFDVARGVEAWQARAVGFALGFGGRQVLDFVRILNGLVRVFVECDASLAEVNPLVVSPDGKLWTIDAKLNIDDNALGRRPALEQLRDAAAEEPAEARARAAGISYIKLDGDIGCMVNGAGRPWTW